MTCFRSGIESFWPIRPSEMAANARTRFGVGLFDCRYVVRAFGVSFISSTRISIAFGSPSTPRDRVADSCAEVYWDLSVCTMASKPRSDMSRGRVRPIASTAESTMSASDSLRAAIRAGRISFLTSSAVARLVDTPPSRLPRPTPIALPPDFVTASPRRMRRFRKGSLLYSHQNSHCSNPSPVDLFWPTPWVLARRPPPPTAPGTAGPAPVPTPGRPVEGGAPGPGDPGPPGLPGGLVSPDPPRLGGTVSPGPRY